MNIKRLVFTLIVICTISISLNIFLYLTNWGKIRILEKKDLKDPFFQTQSASTQGKIVEVNESELIIDNGKEKRTFPRSGNFQVLKYTQANKGASPSSDLRNIESKKYGLITFIIGEDKSYKPLSIVYPFRVEPKKQ